MPSPCRHRSPDAESRQGGRRPSHRYDLADYGLPTREEFRDLRIWDLHYHGLFEIAPNDPVGKEHQELMFYMDRFAIERSIAIDAPSITRAAFQPAARAEQD